MLTEMHSSMKLSLSLQMQIRVLLYLLLLRIISSGLTIQKWIKALLFFKSRYAMRLAYLPGKTPAGQQLLRRNGIDPSACIQNKITGEISRFAISKELRRRYSACWEAGVKQSSERQCSLPCLGLIQSILRHSLELGITTWAAVMEPQLLRMLASLGIRFTPIGPLVVHHGLRQPSFCNVPQMLKVLKYEKPENWSVVTNDGEIVLSSGDFNPLARRWPCRCIRATGSKRLMVGLNGCFLGMSRPAQLQWQQSL